VHKVLYSDKLFLLAMMIFPFAYDKSKKITMLHILLLELKVKKQHCTEVG